MEVSQELQWIIVSSVTLFVIFIAALRGDWAGMGTRALIWLQNRHNQQAILRKFESLPEGTQQAIGAIINVGSGLSNLTENDIDNNILAELDAITKGKITAFNNPDSGVATEDSPEQPIVT